LQQGKSHGWDHEGAINGFVANAFYMHDLRQSFAIASNFAMTDCFSALGDLVERANIQRLGPSNMALLNSCPYGVAMTMKVPYFVIALIAAATLANCGANSNSTSSITTEASALSSPTSPNQTRPAGPQEPPCGTIEISKNGVISGQQFQSGSYVIHSFGIACDEVLGDEGLFMKFLRLNGAPLPEPWSFLEGAVGAPKFVTGPAIGFRVQKIS